VEVAMINRGILKQVLIEQNEFIKPSSEYIRRELLDEVSSLVKLRHIIVVTGVRRAGKSVFLSQIVNEFYSPDDVYYLNLDDERLAGLKIEDAGYIMDVFAELFGNRKIVFFDEIQNLNGWERFVSRLYNEGFKIYITGSNAKLLSSELSTFLTGRHMDIEISPFSFREFLTYHRINIKNEHSFYRRQVRAKIRSLFDEYLLKGGFPEVARYKDISILRTLFSDIITKDVLARYSVKNAKTLKDVASFLVSNSAKEFSYNRIKNVYSLGSVHTVKNYIDYLASSYVFSEVLRFSFSLKESQVRNKKIYTLDNGFISALGLSMSQDTGRLYENVVFNELKRRGGDIFFYRDKQGKEIDFLLRNKRKIYGAIQVCFNVDDNVTLGREIKSLTSGLRELKLKKGIILTSDREDLISVGSCQIKLVPAYKYLVFNLENGE